MDTSRLRTKQRGRLARGLFILGVPLIMGQLDDCNSTLPPVSNAFPLAVDCVADGTQIFMPLAMSAVADRPFYALKGGAIVDTTATVRIPSAMFCAMADAQATQTDIESGALGINFDGVRTPGDFFALHTAVNLPIQNIDIAGACAGTYGADILVDFGTVQTVPWPGEAWTVNFTVPSPPASLILFKNIDLPGLPIPGPTVDLLTFCDPTDKSEPPNGTTDDPEDSPRLAADRDLDGVYESLATATDQVRLNVQGYCAGYRCDDLNDCTIDTCNPDIIVPFGCSWNNKPDGTSCDSGGQPGVCSAGTCVDPDPTCGPDPSQCTKNISLGCTNNVTSDVTMLEFELTVTPDPVIGGAVVPVNYDGVAAFPQVMLDGAQPAIVGGAVDLVDVQATVHVRSGATGADVTLISEPIATTCLFDSATCDPLNDGASVPGSRPNTDCVPTGSFNPCQALVSVPESSDCTVGGVCDLLGKGPGTPACDTYGYCITGPLLIPLQDVDTTFTADPSGEALFGWDDQSTGATLNPDGTWSLPPAVFTTPMGPNGVKISVAGLSVALECTMGVDSGGPHGPVPPVPDQASPTPDSRLINFPVLIP